MDERSIMDDMTIHRGAIDNAHLRRVGIFAGTFDPVHAGHIVFARQALKAARLDAVYFLVERKPQSGKTPISYEHRTAMLRQAVKGHQSIRLLEVNEPSFSVSQTLPTLKAMFPYAELHFLVGSDVLSNIARWAEHEKLVESCGLVVGLREGKTPKSIFSTLASWQVQPVSCVVVESAAPHVSSTKVRQSLAASIHHDGLLASVKKYSLSRLLYAVSQK